MIMFIIFTGCFLWNFIKRIFGSTESYKKDSKMPIRKIKKWLRQNHASNENCDKINTHLKFFGFSQTGEALIVETKNSEYKQSVNFMLFLKDGLCLTIPEHTSTSVDRGNSSFSSKGLTIERIVPYSKWRITYNGLSYVSKPGNKADNCSFEPQHVVFTFFWTAASDPLSWPNEWSPELLSHAFDNTQKPEIYLNEILIFDSGFDQFGSLFGQVTIEQNDSRDTFEMNLPGVRMSRKSKENTNLVSESWSLVAACKDGLVVSLSAREINNNKKIICGCLRMPNTDVHRVDNVDLNVSNLDTTDSQTISFDIIACQKVYKATIQIDPEMNQYNIKNEEYSTTMSLFTIDVNGQPGRGAITSSKLSMNRRTMTKNLLRETRILSKPMSNLRSKNEAKMLTLFLDDPYAKIEWLCGGKGLSLAFLTELAMCEQKSKNAFLVPQGFIITSVAFDLQLKFNPHIRKAIQSIENIAYKRTKGNLEDACKEAIELFVKTPIQDEITKEIKTAYLALANNCVNTLKVAVRSSATGEDGMDSSSAGQNETFLGVQTIDQMLISIQKCWASLFTVQSITYRIQNIQPIHTKMSVVVQSMVAPDCAGVLFTQHPVTNDPRKLLITANYGLGESVVSGVVDPDMFTVQRSYDSKKLNILERKLGGKNQIFYMTKGDGINISEVSKKLKEKFCLSDENVLELCEIGIYLEERYGSPRDIEWAIHKGTVYLLQSRPITSTKSFTSWELLHEFDTAVMSEEDYFTFGNVGEVLPEVVAPLSISMLKLSGNDGLESVKSTFSHKKIAISHYRIALNMFELFFKMVGQEISLTDRLIAISTFGHEILTDEILRIAQHKNGIFKTLPKLILFFNIIKNAWAGRSKAEELRQFIEQLKKDCEWEKMSSNNFTLETLHANIEQKIGHNTHTMDVCERISSVCCMYQTILFLFIAEGKKEITSEFLDDITLLLSSCKNAESAEIPTSLERIASSILNSGKCIAQEFCDISPNEGIEWLKKNCTDAHTLFESFIRRHGHRGYQEYDLAAKVWGTHPKIVIEILQNTVQNWRVDSNKKSPNEKLSNEEILDKLKTPTKRITRLIAKFLLPKCQAFVELRERTKSYYIAYIHELRKYYWVLAERMQAEGLLPDTNLIFFLTHQEIGYLIKNRCANLVSKANRRRRLFPEWKKIQFDELHWGLIKPRNVDRMAVACDSMKVTGTPVCEGKITGRACVVKSFAEVSKINAGDILITHGTDIAWSAYFPSLSGVVTELGGLISHGAVVAREYGLPCIVGATNATAIIADGDQIYMDANAGVILKINDLNQEKI